MSQTSHIRNILLLLAVPLAVVEGYLGHEAKVEEYPFLVHLSISINMPNVPGMPKLSHYPCTGSYIKPLWVLTAAVCLKNNYNPSGLLRMVPNVGVDCRMGISRADEYELQRVPAITSQNVFVHTDFDVIPVDRLGLVSVHNVGLVLLQRQFELSRVVGLISIPNSFTDYSGSVTAAGYNTINWLSRNEVDKQVDLGLRAITYAIWPRDKCKEISDSTAKICVGGPNDMPWKFDIGGPLIHQKLLIGIATPRTDYEKDYGTFEHVYDHKEWIESVTRLTAKQADSVQWLTNNYIIYCNLVILYFEFLQYHL